MMILRRQEVGRRTVCFPASRPRPILQLTTHTRSTLSRSRSNAGAYFGDEGKGKTVDAIARHPAVKVGHPRLRPR
eukprot:954614-Pleurochrysis_carterae.AAC.1